ncbi:MMPL family transporter [Bacillus piscicola]|uniref:MMPL family transporter n=1 Tax=Bacillus piscicola TaxID=1632684 RepID=UPI001F09C10A|nr:MMPL family transporter [Bacillus piscicola]
MLRSLRKVVKYSGSSKGAKIIVAVWLVLAAVMTLIAPGSSDYSSSSTEGSINEDTPSEIASQKEEQYFPSDKGLTGLLVFHKEGGLSKKDRRQITNFSEWVHSSKRPEHIESALPYHTFPSNIQEKMYSDDRTTLLFNFALEKDLDSDAAHETLAKMEEEIAKLDLPDTQTEITGPAGISSDTIEIFQNADFILMAATVLLIFVLLIIIYRSPLLAIVPLVIAGIVYQVVDRVLGLAGKNGWFSVDGQAVSIMTVLLFAILTDYSLFIFSRYREELKRHTSKYDAMKEAIFHVSEPIFFSGGTILLAMLTLFTAVFKPYHHFAPVFSTAIVIIFLAGLTLIPSFFALMGRRTFWPSVPKENTEEKSKKGFWEKAALGVSRRPRVIAIVLLLFLIIGMINVPSIAYSFNLMKSFPEDMSSRAGFELLEENYPPGQLAPVHVILESDSKRVIDQEALAHIKSLQEMLAANEDINSVSPRVTSEMVEGKADLMENFLSEKKNAVKMQLILDHHPYDAKSINAIETLREEENSLLRESGLPPDQYQLHLAGQTADQLDIRSLNVRDMVVVFSIVTALLCIMLSLQTKSFKMAALMMGTILLSYTAVLGFSWMIFHYIIGLESVSYRLPLYTFVFMVALGVDYNIMLVARIREEAEKIPWKEAVIRGLGLTGGVISSAGVILAATFSVLITQPLQELYLFGVVMALGILMDTFLIRGMLMPALLIVIHKDKEDEIVEER